MPTHDVLNELDLTWGGGFKGLIATWNNLAVTWKVSHVHVLFHDLPPVSADSPEVVVIWFLFLQLNSQSAPNKK